MPFILHSQTKLAIRAHRPRSGTTSARFKAKSSTLPLKESKTLLYRSCKVNFRRTTCKYTASMALETNSGRTGNVRVILQGMNIQVTDAIKEYAEGKVNLAVGHFEASVKEVDVRFSARGGHTNSAGRKQQKVEITAYTKAGVVRAEDVEDTLYASIDKVADKLNRKLRKLKEKNLSFRRASTTKATVELVEPSLPSVNAEAELPGEIVGLEQVMRTKHVNMVPCTVEQAIDSLLMVDHDFYMFTNSATGELTVLYRRKAGGYGMLVPRQM